MLHAPGTTSSLVYVAVMWHFYPQQLIVVFLRLIARCSRRAPNHGIGSFTGQSLYSKRLILTDRESGVKCPRQGIFVFRRYKTLAASGGRRSRHDGSVRDRNTVHVCLGKGIVSCTGYGLGIRAEAIRNCDHNRRTGDWGAICSCTCGVHLVVI